MLSITQLVLIFIAGLLLSGVFSMIEAAVISQDRHRLAHLAAMGGKRAKLMQAMLNNIDRLLAAILLFNNIANVLCATAAAVVVTRISGGDEGAAFAASLGVAFLILVVSEISPKIIGVRYAQMISLTVAAPLRVLLTVFYPIIRVANFLAGGVLALIGIRRTAVLRVAMNTAELRSAVRESNRLAQESNDPEGGRHYRMVEQLLRLADMPVEQIMTPRPQINGINLQDETTIKQQIMDASHGKMPVFVGNIDTAEGFIETVAAIKAIANQDDVTAAMVRKLIKPPLFIPAAGNALQQMQHMRKQGNNIAFVVDGAGRISGMITLSNFSAAIIGGEELADNITHDGGNFILPGDFLLIQLGDIHPHLAIPETSAASINGLILETLGSIPAQPVCVRIGDLKIEIMESSNTSVKKVRLIKPDPPETNNNE